MQKLRRHNKNTCPYCFARLGQDGFCAACGVKRGTITNPAPALSVGQILGDRYEVGKMLGMGGFGITYLARDTENDVRVAIKEFFPKGYAVRESDGVRVGVASPEAVTAFHHWQRAFREEGKLLMRIRNLHGVVKLLDFLVANNTAYLVMDYLEGESLRGFLSHRGGKIPAEEALGILRPVFESLTVLHSHGIIHKDISPENIQIVQNKYVKLIDFGAAALYTERPEDKPFIVLKEGYSPPELYHPHTLPHGPWTDVYQMGATLYNCITGRIPTASTERLHSGILPTFASLGVQAPRRVENAVRKALEVSYEYRYESIGDFMDNLY